MFAYIIRRLVLIVPTLLGIMLVNFFVIQIVPGGPVEQMIAQITGTAVDATARISGGGAGDTISRQQDAKSLNASSQMNSKYRGARGLDPALIKEIEKMYGLDKPIHIRFIDMMIDYITFDFGDSFFKTARFSISRWTKCQSRSR